MALNISSWSNTTFCNSTNCTLPVEANLVHWTISSFLQLLMLIAGLTFNGTILLVFCLHRKLWTPFNIYLFNLILTNFLYFILATPFDLITSLYTKWWLGSRWCTVYMYGIWVLTAVQEITHPLIALNRVWALWMPVSYRRHHNTKTALTFCLFSWSAAHLIGLPGLIADALYYRKNEYENGCSIDGTGIPLQTAYIVINMSISDACPMILVTAYFLILYKERTRQRVGGWFEGTFSRTKKSSTGTEHNASRRATQISFQQRCSLPSRQSSLTAQRLSLPAPAAINTKKGQKNERSFLLLTVLTVSVTVWWGPSVTYGIIQPFLGYTVAIYDSIIPLTYTVQPVLDPILFALTLKSLRVCVMQLVRGQVGAKN